jgi:spore coat protein U-like protein
MRMRSACATLACLAGLLAAPEASAVITCSVMVTSVDVVYDPTSPVQNVTTGSYTITCNRLASDPDTVDWRLGVNNGLNTPPNSGGFNRATFGGNRYDYDTYSSPGVKWGGGTGGSGARITGTLVFGGALTGTATGPFDIVLPGSQAVRPAGSYTDTLTVTLETSAGSFLNNTTFGVTVLTTNTCQISVPPGNVSFTYTSFQAGPATANTSYGVRCTTALPYTMALDATSGTLVGLTYNLSLAPASSGTGTGATQTYNINGSIAGGQAGTCATGSCSGSQTRTLTLSW